MLDPADILEAQQLQQKGKEGPLPQGIIRSPTPPKEVKIAEKVEVEEIPSQPNIKQLQKELFDDSPKEMSSVVPHSWSAGETNVPAELLKEDWDFRGKGKVSRFAKGGTQEVPKGSIAIWTTKHADKGNQTSLVVTEADIYYLVRGLTGVKIKNDAGKSNAISLPTLKSFYRKVVEGIRGGKKETAFNNKQLLRGLDMIADYEEEEQDDY